MSDPEANPAPDLRTPLRPDQLGLASSLIEDIVLRRVALEGRVLLTALAERVHVGTTVIDAVVTTLRDRKLLEYDGMDGRVYVVSITDAGRNHAVERSRECRYAGALPVSLELYTEVVHAQIPSLHLDRDVLSRAYSDLVISPSLIDQLGPAIHGEGAMFLYGPPGTGKSSIAERIVRAYDDEVLIPHCVAIDGQIISVFDPTIHDAVPEQPAGIDRRWVLCRRPAVVTGGEMHAGMLDLQLDRDTGVHMAPLQLKANNGILVIDDFGRQAMTVEALLNRWIVPLDRQIDYLALHGRKFEVPFELKVVLSTNLDPASLGDEAFFRRIHNKIYVGCIDDEAFDFILARVCVTRGLECSSGSAARMRELARERGDGELRAYLPAVVCELAAAIIRFENVSPELTPELVERVAELYFTRTDGVASGSPGLSRHAAGRPGARPAPQAPPRTISQLLASASGS